MGGTERLRSEPTRTLAVKSLARNFSHKKSEILRRALKFPVKSKLQTTQAPPLNEPHLQGWLEDPGAGSRASSLGRV